VRENQRRSRARRQDLVNHLQQRLREYEEKEVQATLAMQLAARRVVWENSRLRVLLAHRGVSTEEIDTFLHGRLDKIAQTTTSDALPTIQPQHEPTPSSGQQVGGQDVVGTPVCDRKKRVPKQPSTAQRQSAPGLSPASEHPAAFNVQQSPVVPPPGSGRFVSASPTSTAATGDDPMLEMPCEVAAEIISGMRENGDQEQARFELGCAGRQPCNVKNLTVLQLMAMD
jgi:hypothetical protein